MLKLKAFPASFGIIMAGVIAAGLFLITVGVYDYFWRHQVLETAPLVHAEVLEYVRSGTSRRSTFDIWLVRLDLPNGATQESFLRTSTRSMNPEERSVRRGSQVMVRYDEWRSPERVHLDSSLYNTETTWAPLAMAAFLLAFLPWIYRLGVQTEA